jgi:hypothetical protein
MKRKMVFILVAALLLGPWTVAYAYQDANGGWERAPSAGGEDFSAIYLTMQNGEVSFTLAGGAKYKITIDKGCYYCYGLGAGQSAVLPQFYLTAG